MDNVCTIEILGEKRKTIQEVGAMGAKARNENLTPERRSEIAKSAGLSNGKKGIPRATHEGSINLGGSSLDCYVIKLEKENVRVISNNALRVAMGLSNPASGMIKKWKSSGIPTFLGSDNLKPYLERVLDNRVELLELVMKNGRKTIGIPAPLIPKICQIYLLAREEGKLLPQQEGTARICQTIVMALAQTGIVALVDEATGYQEERVRDGK